MSVLYQNLKNQTWTCGKCNTTFQHLELMRAFDFNKDEVYRPIYCMECGAKLNKIDVTNQFVGMQFLRD